ncbi:ABC transporter ATP-binding protein [Actinorhabdospora filicis]|uniref:ABC transporter ATP-binding protein n=1 Tax=Actinorhabdospora filicis TaxID=1785913 RepID=A0A9W6STQ4_9ACTN|nr:oligopeptide/dipeptide ABC transporter ATP-binding protein [Actinorhabdospora filicis]GLZ81789.1 ABC transporter ATP-binding protein [Actinorhabdospora filicis]
MIIAENLTRRGALTGVTIDIAPGETLAVVGESGSGKTALARLLLRLDRPTSGGLPADGVHGLFPDLDPRMTIADSVAEPMRVHRRHDPAWRDELLTLVGLGPGDGRRRPADLPAPELRRAALARGLALRPGVLVLDEPVADLDPSARAELTALLRAVRERLGTAYLYLTRDVADVRQLAERVAVLYRGGIVERGPAQAVFEAPAHPYTQALLSAVPVADPRRERRRRRVPLAEERPDAPAGGCRFRHRCPKFAAELTTLQRGKCSAEAPAPRPRAGGAEAACHYASVATVW